MGILKDLWVDVPEKMSPAVLNKGYSGAGFPALHEKTRHDEIIVSYLYAMPFTV